MLDNLTTWPPVPPPQVPLESLLRSPLPCTPCQPQLLVSLFQRLSSVPPSLLPLSSLRLPPSLSPSRQPSFPPFSSLLVGSQVAVALPALATGLGLVCLGLSEPGDA